MVTLDANSKIVRENLVNEEIEKIKNHFKKFGYDIQIDRLARLFYNNTSNYPGALVKNINFIINVLTLANFSSEEAIRFVYLNKRLLIEKQSDLHLKFSILNKVGLLEDVLRNDPNILLKLNPLKAERLYAYLCYIKARGQKIDLGVIANLNLPVSEIDKLIDTYELNNTINQLLGSELDKELKLKVK